MKQNQPKKNFPDSKTDYSRGELKEFIVLLNEEVSKKNDVVLHSALALNNLLLLPNARDLFDEELKEKAREVWLKIKAHGLEIMDPPLLFGIPDEMLTPNQGGNGFAEQDDEGEEPEEGVVVKEEKEQKRGRGRPKVS